MVHSTAIDMARVDTMMASIAAEWPLVWPIVVSDRAAVTVVLGMSVEFVELGMAPVKLLDGFDVVTMIDSVAVAIAIAMKRHTDLC